MLAEHAALKRRLAQDSHTSSKPPTSDGLARRPRSTRHPSGQRHDAWGPAGASWADAERGAGAGAVPAPYGPRPRAVAVSPHHYQMVPQQRTPEALAARSSAVPAVMEAWRRGSSRPGETLAPTVAPSADLVAAGSPPRR